MPSSILELFLNMVEHGGKAGVDHLAWRARGQGAGLPTLGDALRGQGLPILPDLAQALPRVPELGDTLRRSLGVAATLPAAPPDVAPAAGPSYAEEFGLQDTAVACWPCTQRHVNTVLVSAEGGAAAGSPEARREAAATLLGEVDVWRRYDLSAAKLARTQPHRRVAVEAAIPGMAAARAALQPPPGDLHLAWAAAGEAERFLRSAEPSELELREAAERMADVQGWIGRADTLPMPREAEPHLRALREARHRLNREGNTHGAVAAARDALRAAAVALTRDPGPQALGQAAAHARTARRAFYGGALHAVRARTAAAPDSLGSDPGSGPALRAKSRLAYIDRDASLPDELAHAYLDEGPMDADIAGVLGATAQTRTAFERLAALSAARGVPVRDEALPPEYALDDGKLQAVGVIEGAYVPSADGRTDVIYVGTQAPVAAPKDVEMLAEEVAHSLLNSEGCNIWHSLGTDVAYDDMPEEREAKLASMLAVLDAGIPLETRQGRLIDATRARLNVAALEREEDPRILRRARWAAEIMTRAMRGDLPGATRDATGVCPR